MTTLRELLTAPWILRAETVPADEEWICTASYPELGCTVVGRDFLGLLDDLELERIKVLLALVVAKDIPANLRPPVPNSGLEALLERAGANAWIEHLDEVVTPRASGAAMKQQNQSEQGGSGA